MHIYRVGYRNKRGEHKGYDYFANVTVAHAAVKQAEAKGQKAEVEGPWEILLTREGLLSALQQFGGHANNG